MPDYYGGVAQAGAQMMNSGLNAMAAQRKLEAEKEMQSQKIAAGERMQAARISAAGGGQFSGNDPVSKSARNHQGIAAGLNAATDAQFDLMGERSALEKSISSRGYGTEEDQLALRKLDARIANNDYVMKMMTKSLNSGKFEYNTTDADGSTVKAVFDSAADLEMYKATFKGNNQEEKTSKADAILKQVQSIGSQNSQSGAESSGSQVVPVAQQKANTDMPEGFIQSSEETGKKEYEAEQIKKEIAKLQAMRETEAKNTGYAPNVVAGAAGAGVATEGRVRASDKDRARKVKELDKEIAKKKNQLGIGN